MTDIVERLRERSQRINGEAADEITTLRADNAALREGLQKLHDVLDVEIIRNAESDMTEIEQAIIQIPVNIRNYLCALLETSHVK